MQRRDVALVATSGLVAVAVVWHLWTLEIRSPPSPVLASLRSSVNGSPPPRTLARLRSPDTRPPLPPPPPLPEEDDDLASSLIAALNASALHSSSVSALEESLSSERPLFVDARERSKTGSSPRVARVSYEVDEKTYRQRELLVDLGTPPGLSRTSTFAEWRNVTAELAALRGKKGATTKKSSCAPRGPRSMKKYFATSDRKDYKGFVSQELAELGLCPSKDVYAHGVDFYFGEQFDAEHAPEEEWARHFSPFFNEDAMVGSMPGLMALFGSKDAYSNIWWKCKDFKTVPNHTKVPLCDPRWLPSFNVDGEEVKSKVAFKRKRVDEARVPNFERLYHILKRSRLPSFWIVKPQKGTYESRGMHLSQLYGEDVASKDSFLKWLSHSLIDPSCRITYDKVRCDRRKKTFQYYVHNPLLFQRRKFDLRVWLLVTSIDPLRVYLLRHAYPKVSTRTYDIFDIEDQCKHIRMLLDPVCMVDPDDFYTSFKDGYPKSTASPVFFDGLAAHVGTSESESLLSDNWPATEHWWSSTIWPSVELAFARLLMLVRPSLVKLAKRAEADEVQRNGVDEGRKPYRRFALLSPDLAIDRKGNVYVEEVNMNGMIMGTHIRKGGANDVFTDDDYLRDAFLVLGANDFPNRSTYDPRLDAAVADFCDNLVEPCTPTQIDHIKRAVHEEAHTGPHWYRLYPPLPCFPPQATNHDDNNPCVVDDADGSSRWPDQARVTPEMRTAFQETPLDTTLRLFVDAVDTSKIHGRRPVPGHGRWGPRTYAGFEARP
mmetsp:Transcript_33274/g.106215  ORF Transcript_33274/g.106215 Transcript_33274/m.106215 type:complete len:773 (-) Transcript_33274:50-2368(-)